MKSFISIPEISIYIFINIKISIKRCKNVEFFTKNALQTCKCKILFKIVEKVSKYEKNNTIHNGCWRYGTECFPCQVLARKISDVSRVHHICSLALRLSSFLMSIILFNKIIIDPHYLYTLLSSDNTTIYLIIPFPWQINMASFN